MVMLAALLGVLPLSWAQCGCHDYQSSCADQALTCLNSGVIDRAAIDCRTDSEDGVWRKCYRSAVNNTFWAQPPGSACQCPSAFTGSSCQLATPNSCATDSRWERLMFSTSPSDVRQAECTLDVSLSPFLSLTNHRVILEYVNSTITFTVWSRIYSSINGDYDPNWQKSCSSVRKGVTCYVTQCALSRTSAGTESADCPRIACTPCTGYRECSDYKLVSDFLMGSASTRFTFDSTGLTMGTMAAKLLNPSLPMSMTCRVGKCIPLDEKERAITPTKAPPKAAGLAGALGALCAIFIIATIGLAILFRKGMLRGFGGNKTLHHHESTVAKRPAFGLTWESVTVDMDGSAGKRRVLNGVSGILKPTDMVAILGPSGAGKSTLLDALSARRTAGVRGRIKVVGAGGQTSLRPKDVVSYVTQDDDLLQGQTVWETVAFSALLRSKNPLDAVQLHDLVAEVLENLGITHIANSLVGNSYLGGISGGERKRVAIGVELVTRPGILLLDEPTSGLDSHSAASLLQLLRGLSSQGCPCLLTIHQVVQKYFEQFNQVLLLDREGQPVYFGPPEVVEQYFGAIQLPMPQKTNPADFLLECVSHSETNLAVQFASSTRHRNLFSELRDYKKGVQYTIGDKVKFRTKKAHDQGRLVWMGITPSGEWCGIELDHEDGQHDGKLDGVQYFTCAPNRGLFVRRHNITGKVQAQVLEEIDGVSAINEAALQLQPPFRPVYVQWWYLTVRQCRQLARDFSLLATHLAFAVGMGIFLGLIFYKLDNKIPGIQNRLGLLFFLCLYFSLTSMSAVNVFVGQRSLYWREKGSGYYSVVPYYIAHYLCDMIPLRIVPTLLLGVIVYGMAGLQNLESRLAAFLGILVLNNMVATSLCLMASTLSASVAQANFFCVIVFMFAITFGGLFLNNDSSSALTKLKFLSYQNYAFEALSVNEFDGLQLLFNPKNVAAINITGTVVLSNFGMDAANYSRNVGLLVFFWLLFTILGLAFLFAFHRSPKHK